MRIKFCTVVLSILAMTAISRAGEKVDQNKDLALDQSKANPDYKVQGEYVGDAGGAKLGAQVIALGGGEFHVVFLPGGLPGAGWDAKTRIESARWASDGKTEGDKTTLAPKTGYTATITGESMSGKTDKGEAFELKRIVRESPTLGAKPADGAIVLFDGTNLDRFVKGPGIIDDRKFLSTEHGDVTTADKFQSFMLHVEFMVPYKPYGRDQGRGNSGVYMQDRYECQVLDSFGLKEESHECGAVYGKSPPKVNASVPPLQWQTYDIDFTPAKFEDGKKVKKAVCTVKHNGVLIHENQEIDGPTGGGKPESAEPQGIKLQGHGNPVFFKNVWIIDKK